MAFSTDAWQRNARLIDTIQEMDFNRSLSAGTLDQDVFKYYVVQDSLYLSGYARALAAAGVKAPDSEAMLTFNGSAQEAIKVERALHARYFEKFGIDPAQVSAAEPSPTCLAYTSYMLGLAQTAGYAELVAAILPCFWVYWEVGKRIDAEASADNPYRAWIDTYADESFGDAVQAVIGHVDRAAEAAGPDTVAQMHHAFMRTTQYEWMFWDAAWRREDWPVKP
jgi:thiaminase/transcriptional activator TenA